MLATMRARRSCLSVPARPARKLEKATELAPDEVVVDLEDSVPPELKDEARAAVARALAGGEWAAATVSVRINGQETKKTGGDHAFPEPPHDSVRGAGHQALPISLPLSVSWARLPAPGAGTTLAALACRGGDYGEENARVAGADRDRSADRGLRDAG